MLRTLDPDGLLRSRRTPPPPGLQGKVAEILQEVRRGGDAAVRALTQRFDGVDLADCHVPAPALAQALAGVPAALRQALELAARRVAAAAAAELPIPVVAPAAQGGVAVRVTREPMRRVAVYVPAGRAALPSSVIMGVTPARVAGVAEIVVLTPPGRSGHGDPLTLAACALLGVEEVCLVGGAQAVAAAAYGTESLPAVDLLAGPGNAWVTEAKRQVQGTIGIDGLNGPSEVLIWAEPPAPAQQLAHDLLAQAEHDPASVAILLTASPALLQAVASAIARLALEDGVAPLTLQSGFGAVLAQDGEAARRFAQSFAPEHLELWGGAELEQARVTSAGATFVGCPTPLGDYAAGGNHVLPTGGSARFGSPLGVETFLRRRSETRIVGPCGGVLAAAELLAGAEGLAMHRLALAAFGEEAAAWNVASP